MHLGQATGSAGEAPMSICMLAMTNRRDLADGDDGRVTASTAMPAQG